MENIVNLTLQINRDANNQVDINCKTKKGAMDLINILVTLDHGYIEPLRVMLCSLCESNPNSKFRVFVVHSSLKPEDFERIHSAVVLEQCEIADIFVPLDKFPPLPFSARFPKEACYRILAAHILPADLDRVLYLDPDLVVINNIEPLYNLDLEGNYFAACSHAMIRPLQVYNRARLHMEPKSLYINSGIMLINLELLRKEQKLEPLYEYVQKYHKRLRFFDQDILNGVYNGQTLYISPLLYNLDEFYFKLFNLNPFKLKKNIDHKWVRENTVIIHFCGEFKPWEENYPGKFGKLFYEKFADKVN